MVKNKKGQIQIFWLFLIFLVILIIGFATSLILGIFNWGSSVITPITQDLGIVEVSNGETVNLSDIGRITFGVVDTIIGLLPMLVGFSYIMLLVGCIVLVMSYRGSQNPLFIGLYLAFMILVILISILSSNAYQDLYSGTDEIALELQSQTILSFLILKSPFIFSIIGFFCGIFLFSGEKNENYGGGYG